MVKPVTLIALPSASESLLSTLPLALWPCWVAGALSLTAVGAALTLICKVALLLPPEPSLRL